MVYVQPQDKESVLLSTVPERNTNKFTSRTVEHIRFNYGFISKFEQLRTWARAKSRMTYLPADYTPYNRVLYARQRTRGRKATKYNAYYQTSKTPPTNVDQSEAITKAKVERVWLSPAGAAVSHKVRGFDHRSPLHLSWPSGLFFSASAARDPQPSAVSL